MKRRRLGTLGLFLIACLVATGLAAAKVQSNGGGARQPLAASGCQLNSAKGNIQHVIYIQFDNTHFRRDNPNVPSDLEQMPHLLNFIRGNGTLMTNDHTVLISHTATGILTSLTGVYPDRMGQPVSNSFRYFTPIGHDAHRCRVRLLDGAAVRSGRAAVPAGRPDGLDAGDDQRERQDRSGAVGAVYPGRL